MPAKKKKKVRWRQNFFSWRTFRCAKPRPQMKCAALYCRVNDWKGPGFTSCPASQLYLRRDDGPLRLVAHGCFRVFSTWKARGPRYPTQACPASSATLHSWSPRAAGEGSERSRGRPWPHLLRSAGKRAAAQSSLGCSSPERFPPGACPANAPSFYAWMLQDVSDLGSPLSLHPPFPPHLQLETTVCSTLLCPALPRL